jgi:hypothetical protein
MGKLPYFPALHPDELFYSACARYHDLSSNRSCQQTMKDLFGQVNVNAMVEFPCRLNDLISRLSLRTTLSAEQFIKKNSLLPLFLPFIPAERGSKAISQMKDPDMRLNVSLLIGQSARNIPLIKRLRFCPKCVEADRQEHEDPYWHRSHQLAGVFLCHKHDEWLWESSVKVGANSPQHSMVSLQKSINGPGRILLGSQEDLDNHLWLAKSSYSLLNNPDLPKSFDCSLLNLRYRMGLRKLGMVSRSGSIRRKELMHKFKSFYREEYLGELGCKLNHDSSNWLLSLLQLNNTSHPFHHLLVMRFLGFSLNDAFDFGEWQKQPFGAGPWSCMNKASDHFGKHTITSCEILKINGSKPVKGVFSCDCGFVYEREGPDCPVDVPNAAHKIVETGTLWDMKFLEITSNARSLREVGRTLGLNQNETLKHLGRLVKEKTGIRTLDEFIAKRECKRAAWLSMRLAYPDKSRAELTKIDQGLYWWLSSCDLDWLEANSPLLVKDKGRRTKDWQSIDAELAQMIPAAAEAVIAAGSQATMNSISKELGIISKILTHRVKLPLTMSAIAYHSESDEVFALRRVESVVGEMRRQGETIVRWQILQRACISHQMATRIEQGLKKIISDNSDPMFDFAY